MRSNRALGSLALLAVALCGSLAFAPAQQGIPVDAADLDGPFLLQTSYERDRQRNFDHFMTSRSRIVTFERRNDTLAMLEVTEEATPPRLLARIPIRDESSGVLSLDFNAGLDRVFTEEDRTGEDYYGRVDRRDYSSIQLFQRRIDRAFRTGPTLVLEQHAVDAHDWPFVVHYYLSPYRPDPDFRPFEMENLEHFGLYETYPQRQGQQTVLYATKFATEEPIVFALSPKIPSQYRQAVRDGALYWNQAFGEPVIRVIDAPRGLAPPHPGYNVIEWETERAHASTSHIQTDPLTGEILHAYIFILPNSVADPASSDGYDDHLRYLVAHEVGHALGLRHNFARGPATTVMNYLSYADEVKIGREIIATHARALPYDRSVIQDVYLDEPVDLAALPAFCTDYQEKCRPREQATRGVASTVSIRARPRRR